MSVRTSSVWRRVGGTTTASQRDKRKAPSDARAPPRRPAPPPHTFASVSPRASTSSTAGTSDIATCSRTSPTSCCSSATTSTRNRSAATTSSADTSASEAITLADYRVRHAQYKTDRDLQALHANVPWCSVWDDHEVDNDWAGDQSEHLDPQFLARRTAAFQAYLEHMPFASVRSTARRARALVPRRRLRRPRALRAARRSPVPLAAAVRRSREGRRLDVAAAGRSARISTIARSHAPRRGAEDVARRRARASTDARWTVLAQQTLVSPAAQGDGARSRDLDRRLGGLPGGARLAHASTLAKRKPPNPIIVGGDIHASVVADLHRDPDGPDYGHRGLRGLRHVDDLRRRLPLQAGRPPPGPSQCRVRKLRTTRVHAAGAFPRSLRCPSARGRREGSE